MVVARRQQTVSQGREESLALARRPRSCHHRVAAMKVLLVQPSLAPPGGGNLVAAWMLEALRDEHELTLLAWEPPDLAACNRYFGTSLRATDVAVELAPAVLRRLAACSPIPLALLRHSLLLRRAVTVAARHDVVLTANNEADFGRRGIQYVHYPKLDFVRPQVDLRWYNRSRPLLEAYYRACARIARFDATRMGTNLTLVNSAYIAGRVRALHGIVPVVLHPPVPGAFAAVPWDAREDGFVCIGRLSPEKRVHEVIEVLAAVRATHPGIRLHLIGTDDDRRYAARIRELVAANRGWVTLHEDIPRDALLALVARQRWGIHAMPDEHFGIAVAEMLRAGCVPFVPATGGPAEIVGVEPRLCFDGAADAVTRIGAVLDDVAVQAALRRHCAARAALFSTERFTRELRALVRTFASEG
jgi:glycosyltransferase involved in cell wall biosynthesis